MKPLEAVSKLREYDHAFLNDDGAQMFGKAFGVKVRTWKHFANPNEPKGLTLKGGAKSAVGVDAQHLAMQICDELGVKYLEMFDRGSQLRACCDALEAHFKAMEAAK